MAKKIDALTDVQIRGAKPTEKDTYIFDGRGLFLVIKPLGSKLWRLKFKFAQKSRLMGLGEYPFVTLAVARKKRDDFKALIDAGIDPVASRREAKLEIERAASSTFMVVAEQWIAKKSPKWTHGHAEQTRQSLRDHVFPKLGRLAIGSIQAQDINRVLQPLEDAGKLETLRRVRQRVGGVMSFAVQTGLRQHNPVREMQGAFQAPQREHFASLKPEELSSFLEALKAYQGHASTLGIIWTIIWTACRTGEARGATAREFDLEKKTWSIPAERMKKRRGHAFPLPSQLVDMLRPLLDGLEPDALVFPSPGTRDQMASENIVLQAIKKMGFGGRLTGHGLRACVATSLEEMEFSPSTIKAQLSHAKDNLTDAAYLRGVLLEPRRVMMQTWADSLEGKKPKVLKLANL